MTENENGQERIVISKEDLDDSIPVERQATVPPHAGTTQRYGQAPTLPSVPTQGTYAPTPTSGWSLAKLGANTVVSGLLAGLVGGIVGMIFAEMLNNPENVDLSASAADLRIDSAIWVALFGAVLGFFILAWDGFTSGSPQKAFIEGGIGAAAGAIAGFVGGYVAQYLYEELLEDISLSSSQSDIENKLRIARTAAWAVFGGLAGLGLGIRGGPRKIVNGLIGGIVGGAVGGIIFEQIEISQFDSQDPWSPFVVRLIGLAVTGVGIGLGIGLVERIRRDSWLLVTSGPMAGKEFILYQPETAVGADYHSQIVLVKDQSVAPRHMSFLRDPGGAVTVRADAGIPVLVNGIAAHSQQLRNGDSVTVGMSTLTYQERVPAS